MFKLYEFRKAHEMYQADLADIIGLTQSAISRMEKEGADLSKAQYQKLYERFGQEDVDAFRVEDGGINAVGNIMNGTGTQNNGMQVHANQDLIAIIKNQNETICRVLEQQQDWVSRFAQQNERLLSLLEKITIE